MADSQTSNTPSTRGLGKQLGESGTTRFKGIITGEEYNVKLANHITANKIFDQMRRSDATVRSTLQVCKLPILSAKWDLEPASDDKFDDYVARFIHRELFDRNLNWHDFLREGTTFFEFGHAVAEKSFELTEFEGQTRVGIQEISYRKQRSIYAWETKEGEAGITQQLIGKTVSIPMEKLIILVNDKEGDNLEGISLLRYAFKHWDIKDKLDIINAIALEKLAMGIPIIKKPADADEDDLKSAREAVRNLRANEESYLEMPIGWEAEMMDMKANSTKDVIPTIQYHDRQIQLSVLAQFLSLGSSQGSGSRALSADHSKLFLLSEEAVAKNIQATIQEQLIKQLCDLNFTKDKLPNGYPRLTFSKIGDEDATALADNVKTLMDAGAITYDADLEVHLRKVLRLPDLPDSIKKQFEIELKDQLKAKKEASKNGTSPADPSVPADSSSLPNKDATGDIPQETKPADPEKQKTAVAASAIAEARAAKRKLIDIVLAE